VTTRYTLILSEIIKTVATGRQILWLKCATKFDICPRPCWSARALPARCGTDIEFGGKFYSHLMASCFRNICANRRNTLILFKVTVDNVGVPF